MSFLNGGKVSTTLQPTYTGLQLQTSINTLPIPVVWGKNRVSTNILWYGDFEKIAGKTAGGKGLGASGGTQYTYTADVILGLCEGPISGIGQIWKDQTVYADLTDLGFTLFVGSTPQAGWGFLFSAYPAQALTYPGTAYVAAEHYSLSSSATLSNHNFEVIGKYAGTGANEVDADPALIWEDFLTSVQYGANFPVGSINLATLLSSPAAAMTGDAALQTYCKAVGICFSPALSSVETAQSVAQRWAQLCNCAVVWSGGMINFIPYGDTVVSGNGVTYVPNLTPIFNFDDDDFQGDETADPLVAKVTDITEAYNVERLTIYDRAASYAAMPIDARDETAVNQYGLRIDTGIAAYEICDAAVAAIVAQLILQRGLYVRNVYSFKLDWRYCGLDPMDIVTLTDDAMGMDQVAVRITSIEEDDTGILTVMAEELPAGVATAVLYAKQANASGVDNTYSTASAVNPPVVFEPPASLTNGVPQVWIAACGGIGGVADPNWGGAQVWVSTDNATYSYLGDINLPARQGVVATALPAYSDANPDTVDTLTVDLAMSAGQLVSAADAGTAAAGVTASYVDGEIIGFQTATLNFGNNYALTSLYRGLYGTTPGAHAAGTQFARLDDAVFEWDLPAAYVGLTMYLKLASFNADGSGLQSLSECQAYAYDVLGTGYIIGAPG